MKRTVVLSVAILAGALVMGVAWLHAQAPPPQGPKVAQIEKVKDNLYVITGSEEFVAPPELLLAVPNFPRVMNVRYHTAAFITSEGVVLVDTMPANWGQAILDKVKTVTDKPITHIINTHAHFDHVGSNEFFPTNVEIVAHENTAANMMRMPEFQDAVKKHALPDKTYKDNMSLFSGNDAIDLYYFGPAHTNGDTFVVFRALRVMDAGDAFPGKTAPNCGDVTNGGTCLGYGDTIAKAVAGISNVDTIITGHRTVMKWPDFVEYSQFNRAFVETVRAAQRAGKTADQAAAELKVPDKFKDYEMFRAAPNVGFIYKELEK